MCLSYGVSAFEYYGLSLSLQVLKYVLLERMILQKEMMQKRKKFCPDLGKVLFRTGNGYRLCLMGDLKSEGGYTWCVRSFG